MALDFLKKLFKKRVPKKDERYSRKVHRSEEENRPGFERYFKEVTEVEGAEWDRDGYLVQPTDFHCTKWSYVTFGRYNDRMNQAVCMYFGKEKCEKIAKSRGWSLDGLEGPTWIGSMSETEHGWPIDWWVLNDALSNM